MSIRLTQITVFSASILFLASCGKKETQQMQGPRAVPVAVHSVVPSDAAYYDEYPAVVRALHEVELRAQVNGYITAIHFKEGEHVKKGQKLYSIDQQQSASTYQQAVANLSVQEANLERAKRDVERYRELDKHDAIAKQQVDYAEAAYEAAIKQVEAAKAAVSGAQTNVRYTSIVAPFDGTIGISQVRLGSAVTPGQTLLNTISSDDPIAAEVVIDQSELSRFNQLFKRKVAANDTTFRLAFKGNLYPHAGKLSVIDRAVDPLTGTIRLRFEFPNPDHDLRSGMSGTLQVLNSASNTILIPYKAVTEQLGEFFVYVPDSSKATQRKVLLGKQIGKNVIVKNGLQSGDQVITEGIQNLREGVPIEVSTSPVASKK